MKIVVLKEKYEKSLGFHQILCLSIYIQSSNLNDHSHRLHGSPVVKFDNISVYPVLSVNLFLTHHVSTDFLCLGINTTNQNVIVSMEK